MSRLSPKPLPLPLLTILAFAAHLICPPFSSAELQSIGFCSSCSSFTAFLRAWGWLWRRCGSESLRAEDEDMGQMEWVEHSWESEDAVVSVGMGLNPFGRGLDLVGHWWSPLDEGCGCG